MKKLKHITVLALFGSLLAACSATTQTAPCPNFGASCVKKPINSWTNEG